MVYNVPKRPKKSNIKKVSAVDAIISISPYASEIGSVMAQVLGSVIGGVGAYKGAKGIVKGIKNTSKSYKSMRKFMGGNR